MAQIIAHVKLDKKEKEILTTTNLMFATMLSNVTEWGDTLMNTKTGEIIEYHDLKKVIDTINTLLEDTQWEIIE